ncbi:proline dehydrogenase [Paenibacillus beijingensis]|uniref:proline dehydrogenase n=1 Tax=Paenibacillus beijingensis TaxID=1126833 RepID=A0A0D5NSA9_9BACL|nr:proline dehydrogenase [Paenibacillus beijingensis]
MYRSLLLGLAGNSAAEALALRYGMRLGASRFVAGTTLGEALAAVKALNGKGIAVTLDHLGEGIRHLDEADGYMGAYLSLLQAMNREAVNGNVSLKPTQMGLALDPVSALDRIRAIVREAELHSLFVRLDMENSPYTTATIELVRQLHREGFSRVGTVIQAYLYRSAVDVKRLTVERINLRLVKGAYKESSSIAFAKRDDVDSNFKRLIKIRLDSGVYTGIATHDETIIDWTRSYAHRRSIPRSAYEFQMLYGIRTPLQESLAREGYTVRCYVPYGERWYPYFVRRLAERPANAAFVLRNMGRRE